MKKLFLTLIMAIFTFTNAIAGTTLTVGQNAEAKTLDPMASNDVPSHRVELHIYDTLVKRDSKGNIYPGLAESWKYLDNRTLEMKLRKGVKFHNGDELKASDVVFTLKRAKTSPSIMTYFGEIEDVKATDNYTVVIKTKKPFGPFLMYLAHQGVGILSEKAVTSAGKDYAHKPVGTGPFSFVSWRAGDRIVLKANPNYYNGKPQVDNLVFRVITEGSSRTIALETGEIDIAYDIDPIDLPIVKSNSKLKLYQKPASTIHYLGFNTKKAPFNKKEVRQAVAYAINIDDILAVAYQGAATKANSPLPPSTIGYDKNSKEYKVNIAKAKELLAKAGYPNGFKTKIWLNDNTIRKDISVIVQDQLKQIGIDVEIEVMEWGTYLDRLNRGEHQMYLLGWSSNPDADGALYSIYHSKNSGSNYAFYNNPEVDKMLDNARQSTDTNERIGIYKKLQGVLQEELPMYILAYPDNIVGTRKNIENFELDSQSEYVLFNVKKK